MRINTATEIIQKHFVPIEPLHDVPRNPPTGQGYTDIDDEDFYLEEDDQDVEEEV